MGREALSALELAHRSPWGPGCTWSSGFHDSCARGWGYSEFRKCAHRNPEGARLCDAQELYPLSSAGIDLFWRTAFRRAAGASPLPRGLKPLDFWARSTGLKPGATVPGGTFSIELLASYFSRQGKWYALHYSLIHPNTVERRFSAALET